MKFRRKPVVIEAAQWFRNGDHPKDNCPVFQRPTGPGGEMFDYPGEGEVVRYFRHPGVAGDAICRDCGRTMHDHGWIDSANTLNPSGCTVCPGDWVLTEMSDPTKYYPCKPGTFADTYEAVSDPV